MIITNKLSAGETRLKGGFMTITKNAKAIIYALTQSEFGSYLGSICCVIGESVATTEFILEQLTQNNLVQLSSSGLYTATAQGIEQLNI